MADRYLHHRNPQAAQLDEQLGVNHSTLRRHIARLHQGGRKELKGTVDVSDAAKPKRQADELLPAPGVEPTQRGIAPALAVAQHDGAGRGRLLDTQQSGNIVDVELSVTIHEEEQLRARGGET